ncbi:type II toxin-antitoxin system VapB family antitoxin [Nocardia sp. NPDC048505]|uniref:type II toxin-antitoxin system VapB family antitoxin n=1 Tax=unclassified Nocardia TaxID=2637762 RepID=UPI0033C7678B
MALSIKTEEADRLARELAAETHETITEAVTIALRERLDRVRSYRNPDDYLLRIRRLVDEYNSVGEPDTRTPDEIIGYDENGLPA